MNFSSKKISRLIMGAWTFMGVYWRVNKFAGRTIWQDEAEQISAISGTLRHLLTSYLTGIPGGFPGDYLLTWPLAQLSANKWILTLPHIGMLLIAYYVLFRICDSEFETVWAPFAAFGLFSMNSNLIFHALEIRPYASLPALALAMYWFSKKAVQQQRWTMEQKTAWIVLVWTVLLFHAYGFLMVFLPIVYHVLSSHENRSIAQVLSALWVSTLSASLLALPLWLFFTRPDVAFGQHLDTFQYIPGTIKSIFSGVFGNLGDIQWRPGWKIGVVLVGLSFFMNDSARWQRLIFFVVLIFLPIATIFVADVRSHYWFIQRQFVWVMPLWAILVGQATESMIKYLQANRWLETFASSRS